MTTLQTDEIARLLAPYILPRTSLPGDLLAQLGAYLDLLLKWNAKTNLTAIRDPREIIRRHFGESLFAAQHLGSVTTVLDLGSGAGFPGLPIALLRPEVAITLAESQNKKASFLREAVRTLHLSVEVWSNRAEDLPSTRKFHTVALRAVDHMAVALAAAQYRATHQLAVLSGAPPVVEADFSLQPPIPLPLSESSNLYLANRR